MVKRLELVNFLIEGVLEPIFHSEGTNVHDPTKKLVESSKCRTQRDRLKSSQVSRGSNVRGCKASIQPKDDDRPRKETWHHCTNDDNVASEVERLLEYPPG
jgi:hypothetical protein